MMTQDHDNEQPLHKAPVGTTEQPSSSSTAPTPAGASAGHASCLSNWNCYWERVGTEAAVRNSTEGSSVHWGPAVLRECARLLSWEPFSRGSRNLSFWWVFFTPNHQFGLWFLVDWKNGRQGGQGYIYSENKQC